MPIKIRWVEVVLTNPKIDVYFLQQRYDIVLDKKEAHTLQKINKIVTTNSKTKSKPTLKSTIFDILIKIIPF